MTTALVKLAKRNKWELISPIYKDNLFTQQHSPWDQNMRNIQNTQTSQAIQIYVHITG